jgi:hypothetical protein
MGQAMTNPNGSQHPNGSQSLTMIEDSVRQRIEAALPLKDNVVLALTQAADSLAGLRRRELIRLSDRVAFVDDADVVLRDARLLELFLPLAMAQPELSQSEDRTRQGEVERRVFQVLQRQARQSHAKNERWGVLLYPLVVLLLSTLVFAAISIWIIPVFEQMFFEFGLSLPSPTLLVISISHLFQSIWFWLLFAGLVMLLAVMLGMRAADDLRWLIWGNVDSWFSSGYSTRRSLGDLAWHTAMLLEIGQPVETSVEIAAAASRKATLRRESPNLTRHLGLTNPGPNPPQSPLAAPQEHAATNWYLGVPCHLLAHALNIRQDNSEQLATLREVARLYWDREQTKSVWILSWLQPVAVLMISLIVGFVVLALFGPLVNLITGLS